MITLRAQASHDSSCPEIGPICLQRNEPPQQHHTTLWLTELRAYAEYGLLDWLAVQAMFPVRIVDTRTRFTDLDGQPVTLDYQNIHHRDEALVGAGDPQLAAHVAKLFGRVNLGARLGLSLPLGNVNENPFRLGDMGLPHQHIQFGTGTFDPVLSLDASAPAGPFTLSAFGFTQVPLYAGRYGYQAGTRLLAGFNVAVPLSDASLRVGMSVFNEWAERWGGEVPYEDGNQGRTDLYVSTGVTVPFAGDWTVSLDVRARAWGRVVNAQLDLPVVLEVSLGRLFHFESGEHDDSVEVVREGEAAPLEPVPGRWTVFDFWAPWCDACVSLGHELRELAEADPLLVIRRVNIVDFDSPIAKQELPGVQMLPHLRLVSPDGDVVFEQSGPNDELLQRLKDAMQYRCEMHPEVRSAEPGTCPKCKMPLRR